MIVAVADGHGSDRSPRSADGARMAVDLACRLPTADHTDVLAVSLCAAWNTAVDEDLRRRPLGEHESSARYETLAYGSTVVIGVLGDDVRVLQLGDGDILVATASGTATRPLPRPPGQVGEETESLCMPNAPAMFRSAHVALAADQP